MIDAATVARQSSSLSWRARLRAGARHVLNLGLPPLCPTCREPVADQGGLCAQCWSKLSFIARPYCERLGIPFAYDPGPGILSMEAIADPPTYNRARRGPLRRHRPHHGASV
jgi:predicted amidophosphoribosyltransferase